MLNMSSWPTEREKVVNLILDESNIRIDIDSPSQDAIIQDLFLNEGAMQIVESILRNGFFNNELPIVLKEGKKYVVLEGNRRVAALKAILNPRLVLAFEGKIKSLINGQDVTVLQSVEVKVAPSRQAASSLISSIHTIQSRRPWKPLRQAYFYYAQLEDGKRKIEDLILEYPNVDIPRFVKMWEMHKIAQSIKYEDDVQNEVSSRKFKISTLERLYDKDEFRDKFGLSFDKYGRVQVGSDMNDFKKAFKQVVEDIVSGEVDSRKINKQSQLNDYLKNLGTPKKAQSGTPKTSRDFEPIPQPKKTSIQTALIPKSLQTSLRAVGVERRLAELQKMPYRNYPNAAHDLLRSLLECSLKAYCAQEGIVLTPKQPGGYTFLPDALIATKKHLEAQNKRKDLVQVINKVISKGQIFSTKDYLDAINHNHNIFSSGDDVKEAWDTVSALVEYVLDPK